MKDVSGGGVGQMIETFRPVIVKCKYCKKEYNKTMIEAHEAACSQNPANNQG